jgi:hypothetical protein
MFLFGAVQEYPIFDQNRDRKDKKRTIKDKKQTTPSENQAFCAAL